MTPPRVPDATIAELLAVALKPRPGRGNLHLTECMMTNHGAEFAVPC